MLNKKFIVISFSIIAFGGVISVLSFYPPSNPVSEYSFQENHSSYSIHTDGAGRTDKDSHIGNTKEVKILQDQQAINVLITQLDHIHQQIDADKQRWLNQSLSDKPPSLSVKQALFSVVQIEPSDLESYSKQYAEWLAPQALVSLGEDWLDSVHIGGEFALPSLPTTPTETEVKYVAQVTHKTELWNGDYLIKAMVHKAGLSDQAKTDKNALPLLMAMNKETGATYLSYATQEGNYEAELYNGLGELYAVNDIDRATENGKYNDVIHEVRDIRQIHSTR